MRILLLTAVVVVLSGCQGTTGDGFGALSNYEDEIAGTYYTSHFSPDSTGISLNEDGTISGFYKDEPLVGTWRVESGAHSNNKRVYMDIKNRNSNGGPIAPKSAYYYPFALTEEEHSEILAELKLDVEDGISETSAFEPYSPLLIRNEGIIRGRRSEGMIPHAANVKGLLWGGAVVFIKRKKRLSPTYPFEGRFSIKNGKKDLVGVSEKDGLYLVSMSKAKHQYQAASNGNSLFIDVDGRLEEIEFDDDMEWLKYNSRKYHNMWQGDGELLSVVYADSLRNVMFQNMYSKAIPIPEL